MKILQIIKEAPLTAKDVKAAFNNDEWTRIILHFMTTGGSRRLPSQNGINVADPNNRIRAELSRAFRQIGPQMDDNLTPTQWNSRAGTYGASITAGSLTWESIMNHLAQHKTADLPAGVDSVTSMDPGRSDFRTDIDRTSETVQDIAGWTTSGQTLDRSQTSDYFRQMVASIIQNRNWATTQFFTNEDNPYVKSWYNLQIENYPAEGQSVQKSVLDRAVYGWLTTADFNLQRR